jgi:hypothetical protein
MTRRSHVAAIVLVVSASGVIGAGQAPQIPDLSGTWRLDKSASRLHTDAGLNGLGAGGAPPTLFVTQGSNGTVTIASDINESQSRLYRVDGAGWIPSGPGEGVIVTARWDGRSLLAEGTALKEELTLGDEGRTLTIRVTSGGAKPASSTLVYKRMQGVDPCEQWPTPCRYSP